MDFGTVVYVALVLCWALSLIANVVLIKRVRKILKLARVWRTSSWKQRGRHFGFLLLFFVVLAPLGLFLLLAGEVTAEANDN